MFTTTTAPLPRPSRVHATCAWCRADFTTIVELIDHVDHGHAPLPVLASARRSSTQQVER